MFRERSVLLFSTSRLLRSFSLLLLSVSAPYYLLHLGLSYIATGIVIFISSLSSTAVIYLYPRIKLGNRNSVVVYSCIFAISILLMLLFGNVWMYVFAIAVGGISLSGRDMTPNQPVEQYSISMESDNQESKNRSFAFYNFMAYTGNIAGSLYLLVWSAGNFSLIFLASFAAALFSIVPYAFCTFHERVRAEGKTKMTGETKRVARDLAILFGTDSFAGGLIGTSMLSLWFNTVYGTSLSYNGFIFLVVSMITAGSMLYSGIFSSRYGLVRTMVVTHLISNGFLLMVPVIHSLIYSEIFLFARQSTSQMDVPPRDSFINTVRDKETRVQTNSMFLMSRNAAQVPSPALGGVIIGTAAPGLLYAAGLIKAGYDLAFYARFHSYKL